MTEPPDTPEAPPLGAFSISLAVADLPASRAFYEALGFSALGGEPEEGWLILRNGDAVIGLFSGHVERNTITFNPRMDTRMGSHPEWPDVARSRPGWRRPASCSTPGPTPTAPVQGTSCSPIRTGTRC